MTLLACRGGGGLGTQGLQGMSPGARPLLFAPVQYVGPELRKGFVHLLL